MRCTWDISRGFSDETHNVPPRYIATNQNIPVRGVCIPRNRQGHTADLCNDIMAEAFEVFTALRRGPEGGIYLHHFCFSHRHGYITPGEEEQ